MDHLFFIHLSVGGHLGYFRVLATGDSATVNAEVCMSLEFWFSLCISPGVGLLCHVIFCLFFLLQFFSNN